MDRDEVGQVAEGNRSSPNAYVRLESTLYISDTQSGCASESLGSFETPDAQDSPRPIKPQSLGWGQASAFFKAPQVVSPGSRG